MMRMDVTTTATCRPEILDRTYDSFSKNLKDFDFRTKRLFLNIDPIPKGSDPMKCVDVARVYFGEVIYNIPEKPNYSEAYNWLWSSAETKLILNIEDDWELVQKISIRPFIEAFQNSQTLYQAVFRAYDYTYPACCTSPQILHERFYKAVAGRLQTHLNPEHQIHHHGERFNNLGPGGLKCHFKKNGIDPGLYVIAIPKYNNQIVVRDLGRLWAKENKFTIPEKKSFTTWIKANPEKELICKKCGGGQRVIGWVKLFGDIRLMSLPCGSCIDRERLCQFCQGLGIKDNINDICKDCNGTGIKIRKKGEQINNVSD